MARPLMYFLHVVDLELGHMTPWSPAVQYKVSGYRTSRKALASGSVVGWEY